MRLPQAAEAILATYDRTLGAYRKADGTLDLCHTEFETVSLLYEVVCCVKPKVIVETGVYQGLSTCFLAAGLRDNGIGGAVHAIDPGYVPHLWEDSELADLVTFHPCTSQDALPAIREVAPIDLLFIDSIHTYAQSSWEAINFEPLVREGGYIAFHDSLLHSGVGRTVQHLYDSPRFEVVTFETPRWLPAKHFATGRVTMGLTLARKIRHGTPIAQDQKWLSIPEHMPTGNDSYIRTHTRMKANRMHDKSDVTEGGETTKPTIIGDELSSAVSCVDHVEFPQAWMLRKVISPATPLPPLLPLLAGTERFAPSWLPAYHLKGHAQRAYDVSCYFARSANIVGVGNIIVDRRLLMSPEFMPDYWRKALEADAYAGLERELQLPRRTIEGKAIVAGGWGINVYGHFLIEMLPRLLVAKKALAESASSYRIVLNSAVEKWLLRILTGSLGFSNEQFVFYDPQVETILVPEAVLPTLASFNTHFHPVANELISDLLDKARQYSTLKVSRLYLSRALVSNPATPHRRCLNEERLAGIAADEFGFTAIAPETLSWPIQANLFHNAEIIVGEFGSGLHNAIFAKPGTRIGTIGINNLTQSLIGALRRHSNAYLETFPRDDGDFVVDEGLFREFLTALLVNNG